MSEQTAKRPHDVFISYASENKAVADSIVADFEQNGIRCWYAPRDIRAGTNYMDALVSAIKDAEVVVLVYSEESNESKFVLNEISIAFNEGKTIVPFRLADIQMGNALSFCLNNVHWMDATTPPLRKNIIMLREHVSAIMIGSPPPMPTPPYPSPVPRRIKYRFLLAVSAMVIIGLIVLFAVRSKVGEDSGENTAKITRTSEKLTDTWEDIIEAGNKGTYKEKYQIGDTKEIDIGSERITMKLVAMDEDDLSDGSGKAHMTWVADDLLRTEYYMNKIETNKGSWGESSMRKWLREEILPLMPEEVKSSIREVKKYSYSYEEMKCVRTDDTIWIPSVREVSSADGYLEDEGAFYTEIFNSDDSRIRRHPGTSSASSWWLRSAAIFDTFGIVGSDGVIDNLSLPGYLYSVHSFYEIGVVVGFCL